MNEFISKHLEFIRASSCTVRVASFKLFSLGISCFGAWACARKQSLQDFMDQTTGLNYFNSADIVWAAYFHKKNISEVSHIT